jgi:hypothetical protein
VPRRKKPVKVVTEGSLEAAFGEDLAPYGWKYWKQSGLGRAGRPDRHLIGPHGENGHIEWKRPGQLPTKLQCQELDELEAMGHKVAACDSIESAWKFTDALDTQEPDVAWYGMGWRWRWAIEHPGGIRLPAPRSAIKAKKRA